MKSLYLHGLIRAEVLKVVEGMDKKYIEGSLFDLDDTDKSSDVRKLEEKLHEYDLEELFYKLAQSHFRNSFKLKPDDKLYLKEKGEEVIRRHAADIIHKRLAPAVIPNDGRQTPMRGHPVFIAQHATGCCCRGCFAKWHHIPVGKELSPQEQQYAVEVIMEWIHRQ